ncbi:acyltransferase family protein [Methylobacterium sp. NMS14P]|uniref:acyltransferase family protein n=1 Tax=Methylobacterium sp. NMS14P TaxID=2894310 RepID=UPI002358580D|nr:acyltransferase family protein [Methylobacterium sp. NMS14P]WCS23294.1 acyltransferase family protein [Methylobacterium sp. NMS14P]
MAPPRDLQLDAARGLAVLLVLSGHLLQPVFYGPSGPEPGPALAVWRVIYAFHMPFFFLLCGMVDRIKGEAGLAAAGRSALKLVAVALAFGTLALVLRAVDGTLSPGDALRDALYGRHFGLGVLWFLVALGLVRVIDAAARAAAFPGGDWVVLGGALALSWICSARAFPFWQVHALVGALPFYVAGRRLGRRAFDVSALLGALGLVVLLLCAPRNFVHVATGQYGDPALFAVTAAAGSAFALAVAGRLRGPPRAAAGLLGRASFELYIVSGLFLLLAPHWPAWDRWDLLVLLAAIGLPLHLIAARGLRGPIRAVRAAADSVVDGLVDGLAGRRRRARAPDTAPRPGLSGADP